MIVPSMGVDFLCSLGRMVVSGMRIHFLRNFCGMVMAFMLIMPRFFSIVVMVTIGVFVMGLALRLLFWGIGYLPAPIGASSR